MWDNLKEFDSSDDESNQSQNAQVGQPKSLYDLGIKVRDHNKLKHGYSNAKKASGYSKSKYTLATNAFLLSGIKKTDGKTGEISSQLLDMKDELRYAKDVYNLIENASKLKEEIKKHWKPAESKISKIEILKIFDLNKSGDITSKEKKDEIVQLLKLNQFNKEGFFQDIKKNTVDDIQLKNKIAKTSHLNDSQIKEINNILLSNRLKLKGAVKILQLYKKIFECSGLTKNFDNIKKGLILLSGLKQNKFYLEKISPGYKKGLMKYWTEDYNKDDYEATKNQFKIIFEQIFGATECIPFEYKILKNHRKNAKLFQNLDLNKCDHFSDILTAVNCIQITAKKHKQFNNIDVHHMLVLAPLKDVGDKLTPSQKNKIIKIYAINEEDIENVSQMIQKISGASKTIKALLPLCNKASTQLLKLINKTLRKHNLSEEFIMSQIILDSKLQYIKNNSLKLEKELKEEIKELKFFTGNSKDFFVSSLIYQKHIKTLSKFMLLKKGSKDVMTEVRFEFKDKSGKVCTDYIISDITLSSLGKASTEIKNLGSYENIQNILEKIKLDLNLTNKMLVKIMRDMLNSTENSLSDESYDSIHALYSIVYLLFSCEPNRNPSSLISNIIFLELLEKGVYEISDISSKMPMAIKRAIDIGRYDHEQFKKINKVTTVKQNDYGKSEAEECDIQHFRFREYNLLIKYCELVIDNWKTKRQKHKLDNNNKNLLDKIGELITLLSNDGVIEKLKNSWYKFNDNNIDMRESRGTHDQTDKVLHVYQKTITSNFKLPCFKKITLIQNNDHSSIIEEFDLSARNISDFLYMDLSGESSAE